MVIDTIIQNFEALVQKYPEETFTAGMVVAGVLITGMFAQGIVRGYRGHKQFQRDFTEASNLYRENFTREELLDYYSKFVREIKPSCCAREKIKRANEIVTGLETQIMNYATQEVNEAIAQGVTMPYNSPVNALSPTYQAARAVIKKATEELQRR